MVNPSWLIECSNSILGVSWLTILSIGLKSFIGLSIHTMCHGREPPSMLDYLPTSAKTEAVDQALLDRQELLQQLQVNLSKAQAHMK